MQSYFSVTWLGLSLQWFLKETRTLAASKETPYTWIKMAIPSAKKSLIIINAVAFVGIIVVNGLSMIPSPLFPRTNTNVSHEHPTDITPTDGTFAIWGFIYLFQIAWIVYTITLVFRTGAADILPAKFFFLYVLSNVFNVGWLLAWSREMFNVSLGCLVGIVLTLALTVLSSLSGLQKYLKQFPSKTMKPNLADVWCVRILVQNGIIFYNTWVIVALCINFVVTFHYLDGISMDKLVTAALTFLLCLIIMWFTLENFVIQEKTRFVFAEYVVLIVALSGVIKAHWTGGQGNQTFVLIILVIASVMLVARIVLIAIQEKKKEAQKNMVGIPLN